MGFLPAFVLHSTSRTTSSAKKTGKSCAGRILYTDRVPQTMLWFTVWQHLTWTVTLTPEDQIWLFSLRSWLSFLKTSVQPPLRINKTLHSGEGAGILVLLFWVCGCQEIKPWARDPPAGQSTFLEDFPAPLGRNWALICRGGSGPGCWIGNPVALSQFKSRCRQLINIEYIRESI